jgi:lipid-binding SYLF domain-containing protein
MLLAIGTILGAAGCSTSPKQKDVDTVVADSRSAVSWFTANVPGLRDQLDKSAGYTSFPGVGQYGVVIAGGTFGRGVVYDPSRRQIGWAYLNTVSAGLQLGAQGYKMLIVFEDEATMSQFKQNKLTGNVGATAVLAEAGGGATASFTNGVAIYTGDATGLMAGASVGLEYVRFEAN